MSWNLTIIGDSMDDDHEPLAVMVIEVSDNVHDYSPAADTVEQLVLEQFHDTYPHHCIGDIGWHHKEEAE